MKTLFAHLALALVLPAARAQDANDEAPLKDSGQRMFDFLEKAMPRP